ncbi:MULTISPECIES: bifunctional phosphopantothenoylcysteine decarboxylase/phosphopantothenate--cysteine ligase CoaBC [Curtobacterium]|uniref:bifunctional phosphopantothenoylcysteine decarboxylase/phosphopantothenate--cysteine ligase CoaBC n=1 Tax=Curtobacterium TaxID=2034 RepID=UPI00217E423F|nr:bifunctional phosphopantothenoylcysteine decarboxylase/phosphopantothenate--cysteine ligase CoaBC [Curtobacterium flaccumfaciens]MCS6562247.1 bifunctional phosphopantothenoylcysteine decarboxylase/phosphopantothenate--cysteine ligase CoaBC [Curtobacterium flaccumfaciens pv. poinsettiae]UXN30436.1 bifunctional phosphopantothenoylcysteine decarboxylase/phosphopantothenate--cysteine ligase CoaBC [Curtobacterium flaccumfaciens]
MTVIVGITGGIAAYKAVGVVRDLVKRGHDVHVVPTEGALRFVGLPTLEALSRNPVTTSVWDDVAEVRHVALGRRADLVVIAPATADSLARMAHGLASDLLGTTLLATEAPVVVAPAMHPQMWEHPATRANVATLRDRGVHMVGPVVGALTGDDAGIGRMAEPEDIVAAALAVLDQHPAPAGRRSADTGAAASTGARGERGDLAGVRVVVSAGGTREPFDPVRFVGNRSSGRQGIAIAADAVRRGASVTLVAANVEGSLTAGLDATLVPVGSALELAEAVHTAAAAADVVVMTAAVADYRPAEVRTEKLKKDAQGERMTLELVRNPDVLADLVAARRTGQIIVGFAAETEPDRDARIELGRAKISRKPADLLVVNHVGWSAGFEREENAIEVLVPGGEVVRETSGTKAEVATAVLDLVATALT